MAGYHLDDEFLILCTPKCEMNGCGSKGFSRFVPERLLLVDMTLACHIHDASYYWIKKIWTEKIPKDEIPKAAIWISCMLSKDHAKFVADEVFFRNMRTINKIKSPTKLGYYVRLPLIRLYYAAVNKYGHKAIT